MPDWNAIEADFLATGMAYPALAKKWDVPLSTLKKKAASGKWGKRYEHVVRESELVPVPGGTNEEPVPLTSDQIAIEARAERLRRVLSTTDAMMDRIIDALDLIKPDDTYALSTLIRALKDLREMQGLNKSELDVEEQRARIAKLKSGTRITETDGHGGVLILPTIEDALQPPGDADE